MAQMARLRIKGAGIGIFRKVSDQEYEMTFVPSPIEIDNLALTEEEKKLTLGLFGKQQAAQAGRCLTLGIVHIDASAGYTTDCVPAPCACGCYMNGLQVDAHANLFGEFGIGQRFDLLKIDAGSTIGSSCGCG